MMVRVLLVVAVLLCGAAPASDLDLPIEPPAPGLEAPPPDVVEDDAPRLYDEEIPTRGDAIVLVLDCSASMRGDERAYVGLDGATRRGDRIARAQVELVRCIRALPESVRFNVIAYDCSTRSAFAGLRPATRSAKGAAEGFVWSLEAGGATGTGPAVARALGTGAATVVLVSDGAPNCGAGGGTAADHRAMIRAANARGATVHAFGIACYGSFEAFMRGVASDSGGRYVSAP